MITRHYWMAAGFLIAATAACGPGGASLRLAADATLEHDLAAINRLRNEYVSAWKAADADGVANLYADDAVVLYPNQPAVAGRDAILTYFKSFYDQYTQDTFELAPEEVKIAGAWAFDRGTYRLRVVPRGGGDPVDDLGKYLVILQRQTDGSWKVARDMDNSDKPGGVAPLQSDSRLSR